MREVELSVPDTRLPHLFSPLKMHEEHDGLKNASDRLRDHEPDVVTCEAVTEPRHEAEEVDAIVQGRTSVAAFIRQLVDLRRQNQDEIADREDTCEEAEVLAVRQKLGPPVGNQKKRHRGEAGGESASYHDGPNSRTGCRELKIENGNDENAEEKRCDQHSIVNHQAPSRVAEADAEVDPDHDARDGGRKVRLPDLAPLMQESNVPKPDRAKRDQADEVLHGITFYPDVWGCRG